MRVTSCKTHTSTVHLQTFKIFNCVFTHKWGFNLTHKIKWGFNLKTIGTRGSPQMRDRVCTQQSSLTSKTISPSVMVHMIIINFYCCYHGMSFNYTIEKTSIQVHGYTCSNWATITKVKTSACINIATCLHPIAHVRIILLAHTLSNSTYNPISGYILDQLALGLAYQAYILILESISHQSEIGPKNYKLFFILNH